MERELDESTKNYMNMRLNKVRKRFPTFRTTEAYLKKCSFWKHSIVHIANGGLDETDDVWVCIKCGSVTKIPGTNSPEEEIGFIDPNGETLSI